jgi:hypothetical protein
MPRWSSATPIRAATAGKRRRAAQRRDLNCGDADLHRPPPRRPRYDVCHGVGFAQPLCGALGEPLQLFVDSWVYAPERRQDVVSEAISKEPARRVRRIFHPLDSLCGREFDERSTAKPEQRTEHVTRR